MSLRFNFFRLHNLLDFDTAIMRFAFPYHAFTWQCGRVDDARNLFIKLPKKDEICWTTMIVGYAQNGREEDAWMLFGDMLRRNVKT